MRSFTVKTGNTRKKNDPGYYKGFWLMLVYGNNWPCYEKFNFKSGINHDFSVVDLKTYLGKNENKRLDQLPLPVQ